MNGENEYQVQNRIEDIRNDLNKTESELNIASPEGLSFTLNLNFTSKYYNLTLKVVN